MNALRSGNRRVLASVVVLVLCICTTHAQAQSQSSLRGSPYPQEQNAQLVDPLDELVSERMPYPMQGLLTYQPHLMRGALPDDLESHGNPSSTIAITREGTVNTIAGTQGEGFSFRSGDQTTYGGIKQALDSRIASPIRLKSSFTIAAWVRAPKLNNGVNPLITLDHYKRGSNVPFQSGLFILRRGFHDSEEGRVQFLAPASKNFKDRYGRPYLLRSKKAVDDGQWHHVALVVKALDPRDGLHQLTLYVDGNVEDDQRLTLSYPDSSTLYAGSAPLRDPSDLASVYGRYMIDATRQPNLNRQGRLGSVSDMDELFAYRRALSPGEVRALIHKNQTGLLRAWPPVPADELLNAPQQGAFSFQLATSRSDRGYPFRDYRPTLQALSGTERRFDTQIPGVGVSSSGLSAFTLGAWLQLEDAEPARLLSWGRSNTGDDSITLSTTAQNGENKLRVEIRRFDGTRQVLDQTAPGVFLPRKRWVFVSITADPNAGTVTLRLDGYKLGELSGWSASMFRFNDINLHMNRNVKVLWSTLHDRALSFADQMRLRTSGPAMWLVTRTEEGHDGTWRPADWANLRAYSTSNDNRHAYLTALQDVPRFYREESSGLLFGLMSGNDRISPRALTVKAEGPLSGEAFSAYGVVDLRHEPSPYGKYFPLISRHGQGATSLSTPSFELRLMCFQSGRDFCYIFALRPDASGALKAKTGFFYVPGDRVGARPFPFAVSYDGADIKVVLDQSEIALRDDPLAVNAPQFPGLNKQRPGGVQTFWFGPLPGAQEVKHAWFSLRLYPRALSSAELQAIGRTCAQLDCSATSKRCVEGARDQYAASVCAACSEGAISLAQPGVNDVCAPRRELFESCEGSGECGVGRACVDRTLSFEERTTRYIQQYSGGPILEDEQTALRTSDTLRVCAAQSMTPEQCDAECAQHNRVCSSQQEMYTRETFLFTDDANGTYDRTYRIFGRTCGECKPYHREQFNEDNVSDGRKCKWVPTEETHAAVTTPDACYTGRVFQSREARYQASLYPAFASNLNGFTQIAFNSNSTSYTEITQSANETSVMRCDATSCAECDARNLKCMQPATADAATLAPGEVFCSSECLPNHAKQWTLLSPAACELAWKSIRSPGYNVHRYYYWYDLTLFAGINRLFYIFNYPYTGFSQRDANGISKDYELGVPTAEVLKYLFLNEITPFNAADIPRLEALGIGQDYLRMAVEASAGRYDSAKALALATGGKRMDLASCGSAGSVFQDPNHNFQRCTAVRNPDGAVCPPPEEARRDPNDKGHRFCKSAYCDREDKQCVRGGNIVERTEGEGRDDANTGAKGAAFGARQLNQTFITGQKDEAAAGADKRKYSITASDGLTASFFGTEFKVFTVDPKISTTSDGEGEVESTITILGIILDAPDPTTGCTGGKWEDGSWDGSTSCTISLTPPKPGSALELGLCLEVADDTIQKFTVKKTFLVGPIPLAVQAGPTIDVCVALTAELNDEGEFSVSIGPKLGLGVDLRAGVGFTGGPVELWAGIRAVLTIVELALPIGWVAKVEQREDDNDQKITGLYDILYNAKISLDTTILSGLVSLFVEFSAGPFTIGYDLKMLEWKGLSFSKTLYEPTIGKRVLDLQYNPADGL